MVSPAALTLGDLLDEPGLGLELVVGDGSSRRRRIVGAHSIEIRHPVHWLEPGWVMLTTGLGWQSERPQRELISELKDGGISALGVGIDVVFRDLPPTLRRTAERLAFPLFTIPGPTPFRDVIAAVHRNTLSSEIRSFGRLAAMQTFLNDALREPNAAACIVERLAKLVGADVAVVDPGGTVVEGYCQLPRTMVADHLSRTFAHPTRVETDEATGWLFPVGAESESWLIVTVGPGRPEHPLLKRAAQSALPVLEATGHLREARVAEERAAKRATLDGLLNSATPQDAEVAAAQAATWGVDPRHGVRVLIVRPLGAAAPSDERLERIIAQLEAARIQALATAREQDVNLLLSADIELETLERILLEADPNLYLGVGRVVNAGTLISVSRADAELALRWNQDPESRCLSYDDLDLAATMIAEVPAERIWPKVEHWLELLAQNPVALETLTAYFAHDLDVGRTSRALHLHPNSTRYRLLRLEEVLGVRLRRPGTIAALHLALLAREYFGEAEGVTDTGQASEHARISPVAVPPRSNGSST
jgi:PucR family transcriptional regulator, purine catabolism regulatory protein